MPDDPSRQQQRAEARKQREQLESSTARSAALRKRLAVLGGIVAAALVVVVVLVLATGGSDDDTGPTATVPGETVAGQQQAAALLDGIPQDGRFLGDPKAPVTMVEWADVQCPFCKEYTDNALPTVINDFVRTGKARLEFRNLRILGDAGTDSDQGARMLAAAAQQDRLWNVLEVLYANQGAEQSDWLSDELQDQVLEGAGVDVVKAKAAMDTPAVGDHIAQDEQMASSFGIDSTPAFVAGPTGARPTVLEVQRLDGQWFSSALTAALNQAEEAS